jgi:hypothetical protein
MIGTSNEKNKMVKWNKGTNVMVGMGKCLMNGRYVGNKMDFEYFGG